MKKEHDRTVPLCSCSEYNEYLTYKKLTCEQHGLQKDTYTYDETYRFLTGTSKQIDFDRSVKTVGTKTEDGKNVAKLETYEVSGDTEVLKGVTEYTYNPDGTISSEAVTYNADGEKITTSYSYDYSLFENPQNGKHTVTATVITTDESGNTRSESTTVEYDLLGNVIKEIAADGEPFGDVHFLAQEPFGDVHFLAHINTISLKGQFGRTVPLNFIFLK